MGGSWGPQHSWDWEVRTAILLAEHPRRAGHLTYLNLFHTHNDPVKRYPFTSPFY